MARPAASPEVEATITAAIPLRRLGGRGGAADRAAHLRRGNARYVTGAILDCDGGGVLGDASADAAASPRRTCT